MSASQQQKEVLMLTKLYPKVFDKYVSLPLFGPVIDGFVAWLAEQGYTHRSSHDLVYSVARMDRYLRQRGLRSIDQLAHRDFEACWMVVYRRFPPKAGSVYVLERYLQAKGLIKPCPSQAPSRIARYLAAYGDYLREFRGLAPHTIGNHIRTATEFLKSLAYETQPTRLSALAAGDIEHFVRDTGRRLSRASLQHTVAALRSFLRFLATRGDIRPGLDRQIDTPRLYRLEQLPRALPWDTVQAFLRSIDRTTPIGLRDYTIFFLMATYGLRAGETVALTLDDIDWRAARIQLAQPKTGTRLELPLTDEAGMALLQYLRRVRPHPPYRELFLRVLAPIGPLTSATITMAFKTWTRRSGLPIPLQGSHCLRHSYAVHLLRSGTPLKTIGDLLGHRSAESTWAYLRLATEDLRGVALSVPAPRNEARATEVTR
jgi:integrase/recombinase XerD